MGRRPVLRLGWRRNGLGFDLLRSGAEPHLHRRWQLLTMESLCPQPWQWRQPVCFVDRRGAPRDRKIRVALPVGAT